jgi:hypothetical protein
MGETAQDNIIQFPNHDEDLRNRIQPDAEHLAGQTIHPAELKPDDDSSLEKIREGLGEAVHISGKAAGTLGEKLGGENITYIEEKASKDWRRILEKMKLKKKAA